MLKRKIFFSCTLIITFSSLGVGSPLKAQIFQNENFSCEDIVVAGQIEGPPFDAFGNPYMSTSLACGNLDDYNGSGETRFADCVTQRSPLPTAMSFLMSNSLFVNREAHGQNCVNAGEPNPQFGSSVTLSSGAFNTETDLPMQMGTIRAGHLREGLFEDIALVNRSNNASEIERSIQYLFSDNQGGFPEQFMPSVVDLDDTLMQQPFTYPAYFFGSDRTAADRSLLLMNCDADPVDEAVVAVQLTTARVGFLVSQNQGKGLQDVKAEGVFQLPTAINETSRVVLTHGDFNHDGISDIVAAVNTRGDGNDEVVFCAGDGACGFNCPDSEQDAEVFNLTQACKTPNCNPYPSSIASGDFNGDGLLDLAIAESRSSQLRYLFNNDATGANGKLTNWNSSVVSFAKQGSQALPLVVAAGKFSLEAFKKNLQELAVTVAEFVPDLNGNEAESLVYIVTTDGIGGLNDPIPLHFSPQNSVAVSSLETSDFDRCGGDDIIALAQTTEAPNEILRRASLFLNTNEAATITGYPADKTGNTGVPVTLQGSCDDPTRDERTVHWKVLQAPAGATPTFSQPDKDLIDNEIEASTEFQADRGGEYTVEFRCEDFCGLGEAKQLKISLAENPPPPPPPPPPPVPGPQSMAQGGCIANLNGSQAGQGAHASWLWVLAALGMTRTLRGKLSGQRD